MNFTNIVLKNLKYNFTKFTSYIFVNIFVIAVLFTYGSIVFNKNITEDPILSATMDFVNMGIIAILLFSIVFISYTGVYFIKTRGKELGVYLTLGMTKKDLSKMILLESTTIMLISVVAGMLTGLLFSGLFYLILSNVLDSENLFYLNGSSFLLSIGVFFIVFVWNIVFSAFFIKRTEITRITKSDKTKGMKSPKKVTGFFGIFLFVLSTTMLYLSLTDHDIMNPLSDKMTIVIFTNVSLQFISLYFLIASGLDFIVALLSKHKEFYNKNILILSNLKYSFVTYKSTLYMITLLMGMSILFMGIQWSFKVANIKIMENVLPYDFMIESRGEINSITKEVIYELGKQQEGEITEFITYPYLTVEIYRENETWLYNYGTTTMIISESNFNHVFGTDLKVDQDELLMISNSDEDFANTKIDYDTYLVPDTTQNGENRAQNIRDLRPTREEFYELLELDGVSSLSYSKENTKAMYYPFINSYGEMEFATVIANVLDDAVYESIKNPEITTVSLFDYEGVDLEFYEKLMDVLRMYNGNNDLWTSVDLEHEVKTTAEEFKPISKYMKVEQTNKLLGMFSFTMTFISLLFLVSSSVVMYYKLVNDVDYEKEQIALFKKIGLNDLECRKYLNQHTGIIFFTPLLLGGTIGLFYNYFFFYNVPNRNYLLQVVLIMYVCFVVYDILFFFLVKRSLIRNVMQK